MYNTVYEPGCIAAVKPRLCHSLVLYNFTEQQIQHPAVLRGTFGTPVGMVQ